jgi:membrane protease YdiL (CAAX protease family)
MTLDNPDIESAAIPESAIPAATPANYAPRASRVFASGLFVAIWIALGFVLRLDANTYLLVGIPLTVIFQVVVKKEPLRALWLRSAPKLALTGRFYILAVLVLCVPAYSMFKAIAGHGSPPIVLWMVACIAGVFAAAYALQSFDRVAVRALLICLATGGLIGVLLLLLAVAARHRAIPPDALLSGARWFLLYFPVCFMIEEVSFRGAIDSYVQRQGESRPWLSALFVSALWGLWHLPTAAHPTVATAIVLVIVQSLTGVPLSFAWRRSGNLAVTSAVHAFLDAVRNGLGLMG